MKELSDGSLRRAGGRLVAGLPQGTTLPDAQWRARHRGLVALLWAHVVGLPIVGLLEDVALWHALLAGAIVACFALAARIPLGSRRAQAVVVALGLLTGSAVLVHLTHGLTEAHFEYFVVVALLALYEDWVLFAVAALFVLVQHGVMGAFIDRGSVFDHPGSAWKWAAIDTGFVAALGVACIVNLRASARERGIVGSLVDALEEGVVLLDRGGRVLTANPSARRILGADPRALLGGGDDAPWTLVAEDGTALEPDRHPARLTARTGEPCTGVIVGLRRPEARGCWLSITTRALRDGRDDPPPYEVVVSLSDVTDQREAVDALERSNAELQQFAYVASHDLSEPLRMVSSYLQLLRRRYRGQLDSDADEFIDYAVDGATRMRSLIEDLLAYSRAGRGTEPQPVETSQVVADVLRTLASAMVRARAAVEVGELPAVMGDRVQLEQLFQNLLANALKFRSNDRARLWVHAETLADQAGMAQFSIADAGIGIDPRHRERVFKMFQRLHHRDSYEGTGIGLAICRKIVERHGGRIWVDAREDGGTVFRFTLPLAATRGEPEDDAQEDRASAPAPA